MDKTVAPNHIFCSRFQNNEADVVCVCFIWNIQEYRTGGQIKSCSTVPTVPRLVTIDVNNSFSPITVVFLFDLI